MTSESPSGSCLCGDVAYTVNGDLRDVLDCHCVRCRKSTGNFMAATAARASAITVVDDRSALCWFSPDDDPNVAYAFCRRCGSSLFWRVVGEHSDPLVSICAGTLDRSPQLKTVAIWFADHAAPHTSLDPTIDHVMSWDL